MQGPGRGGALMSDGGGMDGGGIGLGAWQEASGKMNQHVREAEARRGPSGGPDHEPPRGEGMLRRIARKLRDRARL